MKNYFILLAFVLTTFISNAQETASSDSLRNDAVKLFIDCVRCDMNHIRREIPFVNYVRDVNDAEVYLMETMETTGSGGRQYSYFFTGLKKYQGLNDTLVYSSRPDDTNEHQRQGRTKMMQMGLMRYVARTPAYQEVKIENNGFVEVEEVSDKWNHWVFEIETRPRFESQEIRKEISLDNSFTANKITSNWKIEFRLNQELNRTKYIFEDETQTVERTQMEFDNLVVKSISDHWSVGSRVNLLTSTFSNLEFNARILPSIEYNLFPYSESTHRQLRLLYGIGPSVFYYNDSTIYDQIQENLWTQQLQIAYQIQEKWGSINVSLEGSQYLHDFSKYRIELGGFINVRILKGLSLNIRGNVAQIKDQLALAKGDLSEADILLQLQELATAYSIDGGIGITYTFGSIFNNVVNPRFGNRRRF